MEGVEAMYLKRVEAHGFKSFADKTVINFDQGVIGIVGPNGSGKSNISDSIKWVLGESSMKSLRGKSSDDIIFSGSSDRPALNMAEVTLVFDNTNRTLNIDYNEVQVTRRVFRGSGDSEYMLNKEPCRKKDISDLLMDTGLGKNTLSIISQGTVSQFAEAKPEDRRALFEDAAGVAKYKQRKVESLRKLERTSANLDRVADIIKELSRQIAPLRRQSEKAQIYIEKKSQLEEIEVGFIVGDVKNSLKIEDELKKEINTITTKISDLTLDHDTKDSKLDVLKQKGFAADKEMHILQGKLVNCGEKITSLESQKMQSSNIASTADDAEAKIARLKENILNDTREIKSYKSNLESSMKELNEIYASSQSSTTELADLRTQLTSKLAELNRLQSKQELLEDQVNNKSNLYPGVRAIVNNKNAVSGFCGLVEELFKIDEEHEICFDSFTTSIKQNIVLNTVNDVKKAVKFLKDNNAGKATFLPIDGVVERRIRDEMLLAPRSIKGFIGIAKDLVKYDAKYESVARFLYGNTIVTKDLESANEVSALVNKKFRVVSLDGQVINPGGSITGGSVRKASSDNVAAIINITKEQVSNLSTETFNLRDKISQADIKAKDFQDEISQKQISIAKYEEIISSKEYKLNMLNAEYEKLSGVKLELAEAEAFENSSIIDQLNNAIHEKNKVTERIQLLRTQKLNLSNEIEQIERQLKELRTVIRNFESQLSEKKIKVAKYSTTIENHLLRLNEEYKMTYEHASENFNYDGDIEYGRIKIAELRTAIEELGNVNIDAIEEYKSVSERFERLTSQRDELNISQKQILAAIDEMDEIMLKSFTETIENINVELQHSIKRLFGGGDANLSYTDPDNVLESGIEITVRPPGKKITNLNLFSGGEKSLIALSVLFAILKCKPLPLCFLDEVEAPLDQANVERFAKYLRDFIGQTQFIVITHRPGTMAECDMLYGVTMQTKGVTKMVSVKLDEAEKLAD